MPSCDAPLPLKTLTNLCYSFRRPQVGTVTRTLFRAIPELGEFTFVMAILMFLYSAYGIIVAGPVVSHWTNLGDAFYSLFVIIAAGDGGGTIACCPLL